MALISFKELIVLRQERIKNIEEHIGLQIAFKNRLNIVWLDKKQVLGFFVSILFEYFEVPFILIKVGWCLFEHHLVSGLNNRIGFLKVLDVLDRFFHFVFNLLSVCFFNLWFLWLFLG